MTFAKKFLEFWKALRRNWKIKYELVIWNAIKQHKSFSLRLSPQNIFVIITTSTVILIVLTAMLIAFTPLRVYVPGYTTQDEYREYRKMTQRVDSAELLLAQHQQYIDNLLRILNDETMPDEMGEQGDALVAKRSLDNPVDVSVPSERELALREEAATLLQTLQEREESVDLDMKKRANLQSLLFQIPVDGNILSYYDLSKKRYGIDIANHKHTLINSVADGIVLYAGFDLVWGNVIMIQHYNNVISLYAHNQHLLKRQGAHVLAGEPIATMGDFNDNIAYLHFELWHNGFSLDPIDYLTAQ